VLVERTVSDSSQSSARRSIASNVGADMAIASQNCQCLQRLQDYAVARHQHTCPRQTTWEPIKPQRSAGIRYRAASIERINADRTAGSAEKDFH